MHDLPRHTLFQIIAKHGTGICDTPKRVEAMLRDLCGAHRREINIIMGALDERVAADLTGVGNSVPRDVLFARLEARLRDNLAYTPEAARWGVETWALALGILSEAELQARAGKESTTGHTNTHTSLRDAGSSGANPASVSSQAPQSQRSSTYAPPQQFPQPSSVQTPATVPGRMPGLSPGITLPEPQPPHVIVPPPLSRQTSRRGLTMRGCLIIFVLAVILIITAVFVFPAVILILQEEQSRPSINEPRTR